MKLVYVPSGTFLMGSPETVASREKEETQHEVELTKGFYLGAHEVTVGQFKEFVKATRHQTDAEKDGKGSWGPDETGKFVMDAKLTWKNPGFEQTDDYPVVNVSWHDAKAFCKWPSEKEKKTYRLPTEAEWEYRGQLGIHKIEDPKLGESSAKWSIELEPGKHTLKVMADTEYVQGATDEIEVRYVGGGTPDLELPTLYILAIGSSKYPGTRKLDYAAMDAEAIAASFAKQSKPLYENIEMKVVADEQATRKGIFAGVQWLREKMNQKSVGVLFFAGHGEKDKDGSLYFLPVDAAQRPCGVFVAFVTWAEAIGTRNPR